MAGSLLSNRHLLLQILSHSAISQIWFKISSWNFKHLCIMCLCKFDKKILATTKSACKPRSILVKTLGASSHQISFDILKRKKQRDRGWKNRWTDKREIWNSYLDRYVCTLMAEFFPVIKYRPEEINQFSGCKTLSMTCWRSCAILWFGALAQVIFFKISVSWFEI